MHKTLLMAFAAVVLAACAGSPAYQPSSVAVAPTYAPAKAAQSAQFRVAVTAAPFWQEIGDTTLTRLVEDALRGNTTVRVAEGRLDATRANRRLASFDLAPTVTGVGSILRTRQSMAQVPGLTSPLPQRDMYDVGFDASWELDLFGRVRHTVGSQGALVESAEHSLEDVQVTLAAEVARTYFELRGAQRQLAVATQNADVQRKTVALTEDRLAAGRGTAFDIERARSVLQLTLAAVPSLQSQIATTTYRIAVLLGRSPDATLTELAAAGSLPTLPDSVTIGSPRDLVRRRPDVLAAERQLTAQSLSVRAAQSEYLPHFSLAASVGYTANRFESLTNTGTSRVLFGPVVSFPLLDLGRVKQRVSLASAQADQAQAQYTATVLQAIEETEGAIVTYDRAHERLGILTKAVTSSTRAVELAQQRFEEGLTDFLQVLDAQRTLLDAENQYANAQTSAATALVAVYKAVGGTWAAR
ncbi:MAG TPA: efflux transporter outer membrane subunit [Gemmatimonadaceae bacterium]|nr:efflux transporter outer membrane subunit [Gemmatimonadaceae bacterium]